MSDTTKSEVMKQSKITAAAARRWQIAHPKPFSTHSMKTRHRARIFRFLDLPAELRNEIYKYAVSEETKLELSDVQWPNVTMVNHQLLQEALPVFFAINRFSITLCHNCAYSKRKSGGSKRKRSIAIRKIIPKARALKSAVNHCGNSIVLRHITFSIGYDCREESWWLLAQIELCYPRVEPEWTKDILAGEGISKAMRRSVSHAARRGLEHHANGGFVGWRLKQLRAIARQFRYIEEADTKALAAPA